MQLRFRVQRRPTLGPIGKRYRVLYDEAGPAYVLAPRFDAFTDATVRLSPREADVVLVLIDRHRKGPEFGRGAVVDGFDEVLGENAFMRQRGGRYEIEPRRVGLAPVPVILSEAEADALVVLIGTHRAARRTG